MNQVDLSKNCALPCDITACSQLPDFVSNYVLGLHHLCVGQAA